jgi:hypothetical protein
MKARIVEDNGKWYFLLIAPNGKPFAQGKPNKKKAAVIKTLQANLPTVKIEYDRSSLQR